MSHRTVIGGPTRENISTVSRPNNLPMMPTSAVY